MPDRTTRRRWRRGTAVGVLAAGLCLAPAAAGDAGTAPAHGGPPQTVNAALQAALSSAGGGRGSLSAAPAGTPVQAQWHGGGDGPGGGQGGGWGGPHGDPGQGQGQGNGQGQDNGGGSGGGQGQGQGNGGGWGDGGGGQGQGNSGSGSTSTQTPTPQVAVPATPTPTPTPSPATGGPSDNVQHQGQGNGGGWGGSHGEDRGSNNGHHYGWGNGNGNGNGNGSAGGSAGGSSSSSSGSSATPASAKGGSSSSSSSSSSSATPAVTTAASGGSGSTAAASSPAPAAGAPAATTTPVVVSVNPATPAPPAPTPSSKTPTRTGSGAPTGKRSQKTSSRTAVSGPRATIAGAAGSGAAGSGAAGSGATGAGAAAAAAPFRGIGGSTSALTRALTAGAGSSAAAAGTGARPRRQKPAASGLSQPLNTLGHELSSVPQVVNGLVPLPVPDWSKPIIFALLLVCALLAFRAWLTSHRARRLETQRQQLAADLASIQAALIPEIPAALGGLDLSVAYRPADGPGAGGDFYDAFALDDDRVAIIVGDVSGHGREALGRAAHMHYTLRAYVEMGLEPRAALKLAGRVLGSDRDDLFTTVAVAVHDAAAGTLTYATAGHPAPVLLGPGAHEPLTRCASPALGWGVATGRRQTTVPFPEGARACFFTDGVTEARVNDELLGRDRLAGMLREQGPEGGAKELLEVVQRQARAIHDDMAACIVAATTGTVLSELRTEELEVDAAQIAAGQASRFLKACGVSPAEAESVVGEAGGIAAELGAALLRVEIDGPEARATVTGPSPARPELQQA